MNIELLTPNNKVKLRKHPRFVAVFLMVCLLVAVSHAKVFFKWKTGSATSSALSDIGGTSFYSSSIEVNGNDGRITAFAFNQTLPTLVREVGQALNLNNTRYAGGTMAFADTKSNNKDARLVMTTIKGQTIVFLIEGGSKRRKPDRETHLPIAAYPQSDNVFSAYDKKARMGISVANATDSPSAIMSFYDAQLSQKGWIAPFPRSTASESQGMTTYLKESEICCVQALYDRDSDGSRITILHKRQEIR